jgi:hypothetical protein
MKYAVEMASGSMIHNRDSDYRFRHSSDIKSIASTI